MHVQELILDVAGLLGVRVDPDTNEAIEYKQFTHEGVTMELKFGAVFMMARLLAQPYGAVTHGSVPDLPCEQVHLPVGGTSDIGSSEFPKSAPSVRKAAIHNNGCFSMHIVNRVGSGAGLWIGRWCHA